MFLNASLRVFKFLSPLFASFSEITPRTKHVYFSNYEAKTIVLTEFKYVYIVKLVIIRVPGIEQTIRAGKRQP